MQAPSARGPWFERFIASGGAPAEGQGEEAQRLQAAIFDSGTLLPDFLIADVALWPALLADPWLRQPKPASLTFAEGELATRGARDFADFKRCLRLWRRREMLRLGARELGWGTTEEVAAELSGFADACLELSYRFADADLRAEWGAPTGEPGGPTPSFVVMAMGKLGGQELNFSSDVDVIYFYSTDAGQVGPPDAANEPKTLHRYFAELSRRITEAIEQPTADGTIFRVDLRLRPEGRNGPLANSLAATEVYYETFGRTWERQALLRARPCAGDRGLGQRILEMLDAFIYPRGIDPRMLDDIRALRSRFRPKDESPEAGFDVKLGTGGIRDVELVVQTLQLLNGGRRPELRGQSTPRGLHRLQIAGLLTDREESALTVAYRFLRQVEHRLQLESGAQTHLLPGHSQARARVATRLGYTSLAEFDAQIAARRAAVVSVVATFEDRAPDAPLQIVRVLDPTLPRPDLETLLGELGFADAATAADSIELVGRRLPVALLVDAVASAEPDRALAGFRDLTLRGSLGLLSLLRDHPQLQRMLATLFGVSERLSRLLMAHPALWPSFVEGLGEPVRSKALLAASLDQRVGDAADDDEADALASRRLHVEETLRIGLHDVSGNLTVGQVAQQLTELAEVCLARGLGRALARVAARYGTPNTGLTVLGLGSLGGYEMRYGSDLDLVFLFGADGQTSTGVEHREFYTRVARRLIASFGALLQNGRLYSIDTALRPSGEQGLLVTTQAAFERYHQNEAAAWERVALLRARVVFSTAPVPEQAAFKRTLDAIVYEGPMTFERFASELRRVRTRVEAERGRVLPGSRHLRFDPGGLMDLEFLCALGQLLGGATDEALRTTETTRALERLVAIGWPASLLADYGFLRTLAMRMRLLRDRPEDVINPADFAPLARTLEMDVATLIERVTTTMQRVRASFIGRFP